MQADSRIKNLVRDHWGLMDLEAILQLAHDIDPEVNRAQLTNIAHRLRDSGALSDEQKYRNRQTTKIWSEEDNEALTELAGDYSVTEIAERLGATPGAVRQKASSLQISLAYDRDPPTPLANHELRVAAQMLSIARCSEMSINRAAYAMRVLEAAEAAEGK
jgi:transposase-like protein